MKHRMILELLGDYYRAQGVAEQPVEERGPGDTTYYWFEVFRRASLIATRYPCWHVSMDVYLNSPPPEHVDSPASNQVHGLKVKPAQLIVSRDATLESILQAHAPIDNLRVETLIVEEGGRVVETISVHYRICGFAEKPPYVLLEEIYRVIVLYLEKRDPYSLPLWVDIKYIMRLKG